MRTGHKKGKWILALSVITLFGLIMIFKFTNHVSSLEFDSKNIDNFCTRLVKEAKSNDYKSLIVTTNNEGSAKDLLKDFKGGNFVINKLEYYEMKPNLLRVSMKDVGKEYILFIDRKNTYWEVYANGFVN